MLFSLFSFVLRSLAILPGSPSAAPPPWFLTLRKVEGEGRGHKKPEFIVLKCAAFLVFVRPILAKTNFGNPIWLGQSIYGCVSLWGPSGWGSPKVRNEDQTHNTTALKNGAPKGGGAKISRFLFPSLAPIFALFVSSFLVEISWCLKRPQRLEGRPVDRPAEDNEKTPREKRERERERKKKRNGGKGEGKERKSKILGGSAEEGPGLGVRGKRVRASFGQNCLGSWCFGFEFSRFGLRMLCARAK